MSTINTDLLDKMHSEKMITDYEWMMLVTQLKIMEKLDSIHANIELQRRFLQKKFGWF